MDKKNRNMEDAIRNSFESDSRKAPGGLWENIAAFTNQSAEDGVIKDSFDQQEQVEAPMDTWSQLKRQIIIDEVWISIQKIQQRRRRAVIWLTTLGVASSLLLLFFNFDLNSTDPFVRKQKGHNQTEKDPYPTENIDNGVNKDESNHLKADDTESLPTSAVIVDGSRSITTLENKGNEDLEKVATVINHASEGKFNDPLAVEKSKLSSTSTIQKLPIHLPENITAYRENPIFQIVPIQPTYNDELSKAWQLGLSVDYSNTWILNKDIKNSLRRESLIKNNLSFGYHIGISAVYQINDQSAFGLSYDFKTWHRQSYKRFTEGRMDNIQMALSGQRIQLDYRLAFAQNQTKATNLILSSGVFLSHHLKQVHEINNLSLSNNSFSDYNYGGIIGIGKVHRSGKLILEYGIRTAIGIRNIHLESPEQPKKFNFTNTYSTGVYTSIRYQL